MICHPQSFLQKYGKYYLLLGSYSIWCNCLSFLELIRSLMLKKIYSYQTKIRFHSTAWKVHKYGVFLVRFSSYLNWIRIFSEQICVCSQIRENAVQKNLRIWSFFRSFLTTKRFWKSWQISLPSPFLELTRYKKVDFSLK